MRKTYKMLDRERQVGMPLEVFIPLRYEQGAKHAQIARELNIYASELSNWMPRLGLRFETKIVRDPELLAVA